MGPPLFPTVFWCDTPEAGLIGAVSLFKFRRIKHLVVAAITEFVVPRAAPLDERIRKRRFSNGGPRVRILLPPAESLSLVGLYLRGQEPRLSARVSTANL